MKLHELTAIEGATKPNYRKGRGAGSGNGKTAGKGHKGQNARSGGGVRPGFEGGQLPLYRKLPKRGFHNRFALHYTAVNVDKLNAFNDGDVVDLVALIEKGIVNKDKGLVNKNGKVICRNRFDGLKVLGNGELTKKLTVKAAVFSATAKEKIEAAGGKTEEV